MNTVGEILAVFVAFALPLYIILYMILNNNKRKR